MRIPLLLSLSGFLISALMVTVFDSQFGAGVGFAVGLMWLGVWLDGKHG